MNQYIIPLPHNDPRLFSHVSHAFSLVDLGKRLLDAAKNGDVEEVKNLMNSGAPFTTDWLGISPLHFAAMNGHLSSCEALLSAGISRDARTKVDRTPLHLAAQEGHADIVELLLCNGAEIGAKDMLCMTALHWAAERGHAPVVQMLMRFGADALVQNKFEMTPLDIAEGKGHRDAREAMLSTRTEMVSSVGRMAAVNGERDNTNAYILTEEETLVPAAPPADEVVVTTATTVDETVEISSTPNELNTDLSSEPITTQHLHQRLLGSLESNSKLLDGFGSLSDGHTMAGGDGLTDAEDVDEHLLTHEHGGGRDVMLVETPDGDMLYVRQMYETAGPEGLAIFTSTGERIHSPTLMAQVVEAMAELPKEEELNEIQPTQSHYPERNDARSESRSVPKQHGSRHAVPEAREMGWSQSRQQRSSSSSNKQAMALSQSSGKHVNVAMSSEDDTDRDSNSKGSSDLVTTTSTTASVDDTEEDVQQQQALLVQLVALASDPKHPNGSLRVRNVGQSASVQTLCTWFLNHGIFVQTITSGSEFKVEFIRNRKAFTLKATYDSDSGTITFYPAPRHASSK